MTAGAPVPWRRRAVIGATAVAAIGLWSARGRIAALLPQDFAFEPLDDPPGFRRLAGGATSGAFDPFVGLSAPSPAATADPDALRADLCAALFDGPAPPGVVPVASFSDYYCPYCRVLTRLLAGLEVGGGVRMAWREWPLLGETSELAARAALAAKRQGAYVAFHKTLMRGGFVATPAFLEDVADRIGVDPGQMRADMDSASVAQEIATARGLARLFGFIGTPALVVGRTAVVGEIGEARLRALIDRERADGPVPGCTAPASETKA
jgi:predicted DsbA family dithiol-disulfide isomerase